MNLQYELSNWEYEIKLEEYMNDLKLNKYLNENAAAVFMAIIENCEEGGFGILDVNSISIKTKLTKRKVVKTINKYLLNKTVSGVLLLTAYKKKDEFGEYTFVFSEFARNLKLEDFVGSLLEFNQFYWTEHLIQGNKVSKLGMKYFVK